MIIASFDQKNIIYNETDLFRGKDLYFWIKQFNPKLQFYTFPNFPKKFSYLFLVNSTCIFEPIPEMTINQITEFLKDSPLQNKLAFSFPGFPFFVMTWEYFKNNENEFKDNLFNKILKKDKISIFPFQSNIQIIEPKIKPQETEKMIVSFQIGILRKNNIKILDLNNFFIEGLLPIGTGSILSSGIHIIGNSSIGKNVRIYPNCYIENSHISDHCTLLTGSIIVDSKLETNVQIGPYTHIRNGTIIKSKAKIGNFVEMKKTIFGEESKAMHLSYLGDATIGKNVNIGAGTITCNYDGEKKNPTYINDNSFIGSGTELIAPITIQNNAYIAAGSTINQDVPENALAIARQRQKNILEWVIKRKKLINQRKKKI